MLTSTILIGRFLWMTFVSDYNYDSTKIRLVRLLITRYKVNRSQ